MFYWLKLSVAFLLSSQLTNKYYQVRAGVAPSTPISTPHRHRHSHPTHTNSESTSYKPVQLAALDLLGLGASFNWRTVAAWAKARGGPSLA